MEKTAPWSRQAGGSSALIASNCRYVGLLRLMLVSQTCVARAGVAMGAGASEARRALRRPRSPTAAHLIVLHR